MADVKSALMCRATMTRSQPKPAALDEAWISAFFSRAALDKT
jgi:hypothetical protein